MININNRKPVYRPLHKSPRCPDCESDLTYMDGVYFCDLDEKYFDVVFERKGFSYRLIGVFG